jgi:hypothetical protein
VDRTRCSHWCACRRRSGSIAMITMTTKGMETIKRRRKGKR